jgi:hypothetical protein
MKAILELQALQAEAPAAGELSSNKSGVCCIHTS